MPGLVPGIHVLTASQHRRRGWPGQARPWRCRGLRSDLLLRRHLRLAV